MDLLITLTQKKLNKTFKDLMNYKLISKLSESISPEILHKIFLFFLKLRLYKNKKKFLNLQTNVFGKFFENPIGLAAGFDKNA